MGWPKVPVQENLWPLWPARQISAWKITAPLTPLTNGFCNRYGICYIMLCLSSDVNAIINHKIRYIFTFTCCSLIVDGGGPRQLKRTPRHYENDVSLNQILFCKIVWFLVIMSHFVFCAIVNFLVKPINILLFYFW